MLGLVGEINHDGFELHHALQSAWPEYSLTIEPEMSKVQGFLESYSSNHVAHAQESLQSLGQISANLDLLQKELVRL